MIKDAAPKPSIDLGGPGGNAFALIGHAEHLARQMFWTSDQTEALTKDMMSSDYEHLIQVFDDAFGDLIDLIRPYKD